MSFAYLLFILLTIIANVTLQTTIIFYRVINRESLLTVKLIITIVLFVLSIFIYLILRNNWITLIPNSLKEDIEISKKMIITTFIMYTIILISSFITLYVNRSNGHYDPLQLFLETGFVILIFEIINVVVWLVLYKLNSKRK